MRTISLTVSPDTADGILVPFDGNIPYPSTRNGNRLQWVIAETGGARLYVRAPGHTEVFAYAVLPLGDTELAWSTIQGQEYPHPMDLEPLSVGLSPLTIHDKQFFMAGQPWPWGMMTGFCDYALFLRGELGQLRDVLSQAQELGSNGRRVLLQMHRITRFYPRDYPSFYARIPEFVALQNSYGQLPELVWYADEQHIQSGRSHFNQLAAVTPGLIAVNELVNEWSNNGITPWDFPQFVPGILWSRGSPVSEMFDPNIVQPPGNYATYRERRDLLKCIGRAFKAEEACWDFGYNVPFVFNEPIGAAEHDQPNRRSANPDVFAAITAQYRAARCGVTFHSEDGIFSRSLGPRQIECAKAFYAALRS